MVRIVLATSNPHKLEEINAINNYPDIVFDIVKGGFNPIENGADFIENAKIKAQAASKIAKTYCLADDSGLCVNSLNGNPGIHSARYAVTQKEKIEKLLNELKGIKDRAAHFTCAMVLTDKNGRVMHSVEGRVDGFISNEPKGTGGFGYDPVFFLSEYSKTIAELPSGVKNSVSHRAKTLIPMLKWINDNINEK